MSNVVPQKNNRNLRLIVVQALVLTVVIHAFFFFLFDYQTPQPRKLEPKPYKTMMLNLQDPQRISMHTVGKWLEYQNPAVMSRPDYRFGYSATEALPLWREQSVLPQVMAPALSTKFVVPEFEKLNDNHFSPAIASLAELVGLSSAEPNSLHIVQPAITPLTYPLAAVGGVPLSAIDLSPVKLPDNLQNITPTKLSISSGQADMMPRVVLKASCGDSALDQAAVRALFDFALKNSQKLQDGCGITIFWQAGDMK